MDTPCKGITISGDPCGTNPVRPSGFCYWHDPDLEAERQAARVAGGKAKSNKSRARKKILAAGLDLSEVDASLCNALSDVLAGTIEPNVATAAATIARAIVTTRQAGEIESRLARLEAAAGIQERNLV